MSNIKEKLNASQQVGNTIGDRRRLKDAGAMIGSSPPRQAQAPQDVFSGAKKSKALAPFRDDASAFKNGLRRVAGTSAPYKHPLHHMVEQGIPRQAKNAHPPTDNQILAFLDKVIENPDLHHRRAATKSTAK